MRLDQSQLGDLSRQTGFDAFNLEKVLRLKGLLHEFHRHPFLGGKLVLKGGTALNLFYLGLARLSVDIDLNYVGQVERELMLRERPDIGRAAEQVCRGLGYRIQRGTDEHALLGLYLNYTNHAGRADQVQVEINFLMRACAVPPPNIQAVRLGDEDPCEFSVLATEELVASKLKAMIERNHPRDLYDLHRVESTPLEHDRELTRKLAVLFGSTLARDLRDYQYDRYQQIDHEDVERLLYPLLRADDRPTGEQMLSIVKPTLVAVLDHEQEAAFLEAMATGAYKPELLFPNSPEIVERIALHPALLWKAQNVADQLFRQKKQR